WIGPSGAVIAASCSGVGSWPRSAARTPGGTRPVRVALTARPRRVGAPRAPGGAAVGLAAGRLVVVGLGVGRRAAVGVQAGRGMRRGQELLALGPHGADDLERAHAAVG